MAVDCHAVRDIQLEIRDFQFTEDLDSGRNQVLSDHFGTDQIACSPFSDAFQSFAMNTGLLIGVSVST